ncbi:uncharacterized protein LOC128883644 [Hylaeus volcanicus]|uniref:uncharacterized protein LOC128883644 n=1 Tax=Hylaeus volcanicus TaxID=313075 RepID=UPI0023B85DE8|nr:uncharacterized protein LOC128883644 [Hylaeus volcanicus]
MSHRKFERPRHGSLGFLPKKRSPRHRGKVKAFPKDNPALKPHFTAFLVYKAGMTHIVRSVDRPGSKLHKKDIVESVTILEAPPMVVVGLVGYLETPKGLKAVTTVWASHISDECRRRFYRSWYKSKRKAFTKYEAKRCTEAGEEKMRIELDRIKGYCQVVRAICHTQVSKTPIGQRKANIMEIQINGGTVPEKVDFVVSMFEQELPVSTVFENEETIDVIGVTRGHGFQGVVTRWGVTRLPRKTHRGLRKVACIGAWHPARVQFQVPRHGQYGYHHRTEINKKIYRIGSASDNANGSTEADITEKTITPMGGFPHYGEIRNDFIMIKGTVMGSKKRVITLRKSLLPQCSRISQEKVNLKFIDTSSKMGHGRFQTTEEKIKFYGPRKIAVEA